VREEFREKEMKSKTEIKLEDRKEGRKAGNLSCSMIKIKNKMY
jgi:hypothetical protein